MRVLITGITGFAGSHLADYILKHHPEVDLFGIYRWRSRTENIEHCMNRMKLIECDLKDASSVLRVLREIKPDRIFHLAAQSFVPSSWNAPTESLVTNIVGQVNIFEALRELKLNPWIQLACSSEEYGMVLPDEVPIKETNPLRPLSPYAVSKVGQDMLGYQYNMSYGLNVVRTRGFNHTGPRRGDVFVCSNFARQIVEIEKGKRDPVIRVGNLEAKRDFTDVRDMVKGYWLSLCGKCNPGEVYNISSGTCWTIKDVLDKLLGFTDVKIDIQEDKDRLRPSDVPILLGDNKKFIRATGWKPTIPFQQTLKDIIDYWRGRIVE
ncbi:GDP-mannose 4,6-dehydratase [bacterium]|nr:GDP-mannose 4,6-dehydratase [candidate division CSSED10-310 bacterium]